MRQWILLALLVLVFTPFTSAQTLYGTLTGNVVDPSGAQVAGAEVKVTNTATGVSAVLSTNSYGVYFTNTLRPGSYQVDVQASGFALSQISGLNVVVNNVTRVDVSLSVANASATVNVTTEPPVLQTDRADVNFEISPQMVSNLPTTSSTGRNFQSLYELVPGSTPPSEQNSAAVNPARSMAVNVNGTPYTSNSTHLDGAIDTYPGLPYLIGYTPPVDAIESVNFSTNAFTAEQGFAGGAAVNITIKSGTNQFHGSAFAYNQSTGFNAKPWNYTATTIPKNIQGEYGFTVGGPIIRKKLFFFGDYDLLTVRKTLSGFYTIVDKNGALAKGDFSATGTTIYDPATGNPNGTGRVPFAGNKVPVGPVAAALIALLPTPTNSNPTNNYFATGSYALNHGAADVKITYNPSEKSSYFGRYSIAPGSITDNPSLGKAGGFPIDGGQPGKATNRQQNVGLGGAYAFSPHFLIDGNVGYSRQLVHAAPNDLNVNFGSDVLKIPGTNGGSDTLYGGQPAFEFGIAYSNMGNPFTGNPAVYRDNQISGNLNGTFTRGLHNLRFGGEYVHSNLNHFNPQGGGNFGPRGDFRFTGGVTSLNGGPSTNQYNSLADFLLGLPQNFGKATQFENPNALRFSTFAFFAQDQWQVNPKLTLTYGVRYEYYPIYVHDHFGAFRYDPVSGNVLIGGEGNTPNNAGISFGKGMIVPRLGAAYRLNNKTVVRLGFGISQDPIPNNLIYMLQTYPAIILQALAGPNSYSAGGCLNTSSYVPLGGCLTNGIPAVPFPNITTGVISLPSTVSTYTLPTNFRSPYFYSDNLSVQHDFGRGITADVGYVGTREVRAVTNLNINAAPVGTGTAGRPLNIAHGQNADIFVTQPFASVIYHGLQAKLNAQMSRDLQAGIIYTRSRAIDLTDNSEYGGTLFSDPAYYARNRSVAGYDRPNNLRIWTSMAAPFGRGQKYLQHGAAAWLAGGWKLNTVVSKLSGLPMTISASGTSLNAPGSGQVADQVKSSVAIKGAHSPGHVYFDTSAFVPVTAVRYGTASRNSVRGPGYFDLDASLFRAFPIWKELEFQFRAEAFNVTNTPQFGNPGTNVSSPSTFGVVTFSNSNRSMRLSGRFQF